MGASDSQHSSSTFDAPRRSQVRARNTERPAARPENRGVFLSPGSGVDMFIMGFGYAMLCLAAMVAPSLCGEAPT